MVRLLDRIKSKIFSILLAGNIVVVGACGPDRPDFEEKWTIDSIPDDSQIAQIMDNIQKKGKECHADLLSNLNLNKCDKKSYISDAASLALYVLNKKNIDETPLCIGYGFEDTTVRGYYFPDNGCIWINKGDHSFTIPSSLLRLIFHEMGHKKHYELNENTDENVSTFFEHYFQALGNTLFDPTIYSAAPVLFSKSIMKTFDFCNQSEDATYLQYKIFGQNKGDFDKTLDALVDYGASEEFVDDINNGTDCDNIKNGVNAYEKFVLDATNGGYKWVNPKDNKEYNISDQFYQIDLCGAKLNTDTWRIETE